MERSELIEEKKQQFPAMVILQNGNTTIVEMKSTRKFDDLVELRERVCKYYSDSNSIWYYLVAEYLDEEFQRDLKKDDYKLLLDDSEDWGYGKIYFKYFSKLSLFLFIANNVDRDLIKIEDPCEVQQFIMNKLFFNPHFKLSYLS